MSYDAKREFERLSRKSYFMRVDETHPLDLWLGIDDSGRKALRFIGEFLPVALKGTKSIEVKQFIVSQGKCVQFSLTEPELAELFYRFCDDLIDSSRNETNQASGYHFVIYRFAKWEKMFVTKSDILAEESIMGLLGELYFLLTYMIPAYGQHKAVGSWSAPDPTIKDFSVDDTWFEVKAAGARSSTVKISSLQQLDFEKPGNLVIVRLEKMAPSFSGSTLNEFVLRLIKILDSPDDCDAFKRKILLSGYAYNEKYNDYVYEIKDMTIYEVDDNFPALRSKSLGNAIQNVEYDLSIGQIEKYIKKTEKK